MYQPQRARGIPTRHRDRQVSSRASIPRLMGHLPQFNPEVKLRHRFVYVNSNASSTAVYVDDLMSVLAISTGAAFAYTGLISSFRVKSLQLITPFVAGANNSCEIRWSGGDFQVDRALMDASVNPSSPPTIRSRPPAGSRASFWHTRPSSTSGASTYTHMFDLNGAVGSFLILDLEFVMNNGGPGVAFSGSNSVANGFTAMAQLDNVNGTHYWTPQGYTVA